MKRQVLLLFTVFLSMIPILVKTQHEGRFLFCAALPLPDVDAAIREAVYALDTLHADGVKLASNSRGLYLGDPALDPLMVGHNVMVRYPRLKVVVPHCGSFLPLPIPRMQSLMPVMNGVGYLQGVDIAKKRRGSGIARKRCQTI